MYKTNSYAYTVEDHHRMALKTWLNVVRGTVVQLNRYVLYIRIYVCMHTFTLLHAQYIHVYSLIYVYIVLYIRS